jgi:sugar/nucleoside kinase (ribokinase family)
MSFAGAGVEVAAVGELLVEVMRAAVGVPLSRPGEFLGPYPSGAPAIFADAAARLGHSSVIVGAVGMDDFGSCLLERLDADGVDTTRVLRIPSHTTGVAFVTYSEDGSRHFLFHLQHSAAALLDGADLHSLAGVRFLHVCGSTLAVPSMRATCLRACEIVAGAGGKISFDPNLRPELIGGEQFREICAPVLERSYVVLPGEQEAELLAGIAGSEHAALRLLTEGPAIVVVKRGARGCSVFSSDRVFDSPAFPIEAVDPTGAGDCFDAGFVAGLLEGMTLADAATLANAAGALGASRRGPMEGAFFREDLDRFVASARR